MIKVNNMQLAVAEDTLAKFITAALPIDVAFSMKTLIKKYNPQLVAFKENRLQLFKEFGTYDAETQQYTIPEENQEVFNQRFEELGMAIVEIDCEPVKTKTTWLPSSMRMSPEELSVLEPFLILEQ